MSGVLKLSWVRPKAGLYLLAFAVLGFFCCSSLRQGAGVPLTELRWNTDEQDD
jgi:hypothetical protein